MPCVTVRIRVGNGRIVETQFNVPHEIDFLDAAAVSLAVEKNFGPGGDYQPSKVSKLVDWRYFDQPATIGFDLYAVNMAGEDSWLRSTVGELKDEIDRRLRAGAELGSLAAEVEALLGAIAPLPTMMRAMIQEAAKEDEPEPSGPRL